MTDHAGVGPGRHVQVLHIPDCPLVDRLLTLIDDVAAEAGTRVVVRTVVGEYPSPTLVINGVDVATGRPVATNACCRLDLPTRQQILRVLSA